MRAVIIGCGYVGRVLGSILLAGGHDVTGVARSDSSLTAIRRRGITPREADVTTPETIDALPDADWVIVAVSSGGGDAAAAQAVFQEGLATVIDSYADRGDPPDRIIYTSSSSVYGDRGGRWVDETDAPDPQTSKTTILARAEEVAVEQSGVSGIDGTVCRFAGLYGPDRYRLDRYLDETVTTGYLNLVHRVDAAGAIAHLLRAGRGRGEVINIVDDAPTDRYHLAFTLAQMAGVRPPDRRLLADRLADPSMSEAGRRRLAAQKRVSNAKLRSLGYRLRYPTFRSGYATPIAQRLRA
jgi:nucleoside-diphosphate-sugar epimerase